MSSFDGLLERAKKNYSDSFSRNFNEPRSGSTQAAVSTPQRTVTTSSFDGLFERAKANYADSFRSDEQRSTVTDWMDRYNRVMQGVSAYDKKRNGGYTQDASGGFGTEIDSLIADFEGIKDYAADYGFMNSQNYLNQLKQLQNSIQGINDNFSQFEDEAAYNRYMEYWKDQEEKKSLDLDAYSRDIAALEQQLEDYDPQIDWTDPNQRKQYDKGLQELEDEISRRKQYLTQAQRIQKKDSFSAVADPESEKYDAAFDSKSGYVSTEQDGKLKRAMTQYSMGYDDLTYEYINNQNGIRDEIKHKASAYSKGETPFEAKGYDYMTEDEVGLYNYYYSMGGKKSAEAYLETIQEDLNQRKAAGMYQQMEGKTSAEMVFGVEAGLDQFKSGIKGAARAVKGDGSYVAPSATQYASGMVREDLADDGFKLPAWLGGASLGQVGYDAITTTANMAPSIAVGMLNPTLGTAALGVSAGGSAYQEALNEGYSVDQARGYGILSGASEIVMEKVLGGISAYGGNALGKFFTQNMKNADTALKRIAKELGGSMLSEFSEEYLQEVLTPVFQNLTLGTDNEVKLVSAEALYAGFLGAITGGIMEGPSAIAGSRNATQLAKNATPELSNATETVDNTTEPFDNATPALEKSTPGGATEESSAAANKMSATEVGAENATTTAESTVGKIPGKDESSSVKVGVSKMETVQQTADIESFAQQFGTQAEAVKRNYLEGQQKHEPENLQEYEVGFQTAFAIGLEGGKTEALTSVPYLSQSQREIAFSLGRDAAAAQKAEETKAATAKAPATKASLGQTAQLVAEDGSNGGTVTIAEIVSMDDSGMTLRLEDGRTVKDEDLDFPEGAEVYSTVMELGMDAASANTIVKASAAASLPRAAVAEGIETAYHYGRYGYGMDALLKAKEAAEIPEIILQASYQAGEKRRQQRRETALARENRTDSSPDESVRKGKVHFHGEADALNDVQRESLRGLEWIADLTGAQIHVEDMGNTEGLSRVNGLYDPADDSIHIDLRAGSDGAGTLLYTAAHEFVHRMKRNNEAAFYRLADFLVEQYGKKGISTDALVKQQMADAAKDGVELTYDEAFEEMVADAMEAMFTDTDALTKMERLKTQDKSLWQEIKDFVLGLAEKIKAAYARLKPDSAEARYVLQMKESIDQIAQLFAEGVMDEGTEPSERTNTKVKYSFAGRGSATADRSALQQAEELARQGVDNETIRQQTGWYKGMDGKWRYEIDDSQMEISGEIINYMSLGELMQHEKLYAAYPDLADISIVFQGLEAGVNGSYHPQFDSINLSYRLKNDPVGLKDALVHEIQHAIQHREGFTNGATAASWERKIKAGFDSRRAEDVRKAQETERELRRIQEEEPEFYRDMVELDAMTPDLPRGEIDWETLEKIEDDPVEWQQYDARREELETKYGDTKVWDMNDLLYQREQAAKNVGRSGVELYFDTAGEIEARDASNRRSRTLEQRKTSPPRLGNEDTVFAESTGRSDQAKPSIKHPDKLDPRTVTKADVLGLLNNAKNGEYSENTYIPVRISTPGIVQERLFTEDLPMAMPVKKVIQAFKPDNGKIKGKNIRGHGLSVNELLYIIENLDSPDYLFSQENGRGVAVIRLPDKTNNTAVIVEFGNHINAPYMNGFEGGKYNLSVTAFEVDDGDIGLFMYQIDKGWRKVFDKQKEGDPAKKFQATRPFAVEQDSLKAIVSHDQNEVNKKFSRRKQAETESLREQNQKLQEDVAQLKELVKLQGKVTHGKIMKPSSVEAAGKYLKKLFHTKLDSDTEELTGLLKGFYEYIASDSELTWEGVREQAKPIVEWFQDNEKFRRDQYAQDILDSLKGQNFHLDETQLGEVKSQYGNMASYRKAVKNMASSKSTQSLDQLWQELSSHYPDIFPPDTSASNMPLMFADALERLEGMESTEFAMDWRMKDQAMLEAVYDSYWRVSGLETVADKYAKKINEIRGKHYEKMTELRRDRDQKLKELRESKKQSVQTVRDNRDRADLRRKIQKHAKAMSQKLLKPSDNAHVPEELKHTVAQVLNAINMESQYTLDPETGKRKKAPDGLPVERTKAFLKLQQQCSAIIESGGSIIIDPEMADQLADVLEWSDTPLTDMTKEQLTTVWKVIRSVEHSISTAGKMLSKARWESVDGFAGALEQTAQSRGKRKQLTDQNIGLDMETPITFFSHFGEAGEEMFRMLRDAQDKEQVLQDLMGAEARKLATAKQIEQLESQVHQFTVDGQTLYLNTAQIMELYVLTKQEDARSHLLSENNGKGIVQPNVEGQLDAGGKKKKVKVREGEQVVRMNARELGTIIGSLSKEQRALADGIQKLTDLLAAEGNKASMQVYGYQKFTGKDYWPIRSSNLQLKEGVDKRLTPKRSVKNMSSAKNRQENAKNALTVPGIFDTFSRHCKEMTEYAAYLAVMEDLDRLYNYQYSEKTTNEQGEEIWKLTNKAAKGYLKQLAGTGADRYWMNLMEDLQNGIGSNSVWGYGTVGKAKAAAVSGNIRVILQQFTAFPRAAVCMKTSDLLYGMTHSKGAWKRALQHSPTAMRKDAGTFDIGNAKQMKELLFDIHSGLDKANDALAKGAGWADAVTWGWLWRAAEHQAAKKLEIGTDAYWQEVNRVFTQVIDESQVIDGILQRSQYMRNPDGISKMQTAFMGEPTMALNLVLRSYDSWVYETDENKRKEAGKRLARATSGVVLANVLAAIAQSIPDAWRDDDEDKTYWERFAKALTGYDPEAEGWQQVKGIVLEGNLVSSLNPLGWVPWIKDVLSLMQGFDVSRADTDLIKDLVTAATNITNKDSTKTTAYRVKELAEVGVKLLGNGMSNILRDIYGFIHSVMVDTQNAAGLYTINALVHEPMANKGRYMNLLYRAISWGDTGGYEYVKQQLLTDGYTDGDIRDSMKERIKADYKEGTIDRDTAFERLVKYASDPELDAEEAKNELWFQLEAIDGKAAYQAENGNPEGYSYSRYDKVYAAIRGNGSFQDAVKEMTAHGYTEEKVRSQIKTNIGKWYQDGTITKQQAMDMLKKYSGLDREDITKTVNKWSSKVVTGIAYDDIKEQFMSGNLSQSKAADMYVRYGGYSREDANATVAEWKFEKDYPDSKISYESYQDWLTNGKNRGVTLEVYTDVSLFRKPVGVKTAKAQEDVAAYINRLPISTAQKDALWCCFWSESTLYKNAPWH